MKLFLTTIVFLAAFGSITEAQRPVDPWDYNGGGRDWRPDWNQRPLPRAGACLFSSANFQGNRFCVRRGDRLDRLPGNFGDNISSIKVFGGARIEVFNDRAFTGGSQVFGRDVADLRNKSFRGGHTWNNRISSVAVR